MYCGDETGSFVGEVGTHSSRFGYGGEDTPKVVLPSFVSKAQSPPAVVPQTCYHPKWLERDELVSPLRRVEGFPTNPVEYLAQGDSVQDWEAYETLWETALATAQVRAQAKHTTGNLSRDEHESNDTNTKSTTLKSTEKEPANTPLAHPLLAISPGCTHVMGESPTARDARRRKELMHVTEFLIESLQAPAVFCAPSPMLAAFCMGRPTALVVDVGASGTIVTPVVDGLVLRQAQRRTGRGGDWLGSVLYKALNEGVMGGKDVKARYHVHPQYNFKKHGREKQRGIFHQWAVQDAMYEFLSSEHTRLPIFPGDTLTFTNSSAERARPEGAMDIELDPSEVYTLPDGTQLDVRSPLGQEVSRLPELFFFDELPYGGVTDASCLQEHATVTDLPLHRLVYDSLSAVADIDTRKDLCGNIVLCGGASVTKNFPERLSALNLIGNTFKPKVMGSSNAVERSCASWIGGSILTSLGSFQQLWLSQAEYEEYGATLAVQRFP